MLLSRYFIKITFKYDTCYIYRHLENICVKKIRTGQICWKWMIYIQNIYIPNKPRLPKIFYCFVLLNERMFYLCNLLLLTKLINISIVKYNENNSPPFPPHCMVNFCIQGIIKIRRCSKTHIFDTTGIMFRLHNNLINVNNKCLYNVYWKCTLKMFIDTRCNYAMLTGKINMGIYSFLSHKYKCVFIYRAREM